MTSSSSSSRPQHFIFFFFILFLPFLCLAEEINIDGPVWDFPSRPSCSSPQSNFTNSKFSNNLKNFVSSIPSLESNTFNFYNLSFGSNSDPYRVEAIGSCNRVLTKSDCLNCIAQSAKNLTTVYCPNTREAYVRATKCMFRYSDKPIFGKLEREPPMEAANPNNATEDRTELQSLLLNRLRVSAALGLYGSKRKYAQGNILGSPANTTLFAVVQCTPDLSRKDCSDCLNYGFGNATKGRLGIRWFCPSCNFQIETNLRFYTLEYEYESDQPTNYAPTNSGKREDKSKFIIAIVGSIVGFINVFSLMQ